MATIHKPQSPMNKNGEYFYPLTDTTQILTEDGRRLNVTIAELNDSLVQVQSTADRAVTKANAAIPKTLTHNPIMSTSDDTIANWKKLGIGVAWYNINGCLIDQPTQYGFLINLCMDTNNDVRQFWCGQTDFDVYWRNGNAAGWSGSWRRMPTVNDLVLKSGGNFTGNVVAYGSNRSGGNIRNIETCNSGWGGVSTNKILTIRK